jgi:hypothetical protein
VLRLVPSGIATQKPFVAKTTQHDQQLFDAIDLSRKRFKQATSLTNWRLKPKVCLCGFVSFLFRSLL